jgi:hypothetical protein
MRAFYEIGWRDFYSEYLERIKKEILSQGKEYILKIDEDEYIKYLHEKYKLEPLKVLKDTENIIEPKKSKDFAYNRFKEKYEVDIYTFTVYYDFIGTVELFKVQPSSSYTMVSYDINVNTSNSKVSFSFQIKADKLDVQEFNRLKDQCFYNAFTNLKRLNEQNIIPLKETFEQDIRRLFNAEKEKYQKENSFFEAINVKVNKNTDSIFSVPTLKKVDIPKPNVDKSGKYTSEPTMTEEMYKDILNVIYNLGKSMEKKPSTYSSKDEEGLRDIFLLALETRYEGVTATGETFNKNGKTDISLKYSKDSSNLFIAECKFWHGASQFHDAISQLFDRYLTWRDSKTALILFVKNKDFSNVLTTINNEAKKHFYFVKEAGNRGETSFSFHFHLPADKNKIVFLEIIAFHFE